MYAGHKIDRWRALSVVCLDSCAVGISPANKNLSVSLLFMISSYLIVLNMVLKPYKVRGITFWCFLSSFDDVSNPLCLRF